MKGAKDYARLIASADVENIFLTTPLAAEPSGRSFMQLKSLALLLFLPILAPHPELIAQEKEKLFTLNGRPVPPVVAKVNGVPLSSETLAREFAAFRSRARQMEREIKPAEEVAVARELVTAAVERELVAQRAKHLGIIVTAEKINRQLKNIASQFPSRADFLTALAFQHTSAAALKEKIRGTLLADELTRREIAATVEVAADEIRKYYDDNKPQFTQPVLYRVRHIHVATIQPAGGAADEASRKKAARITKMINAAAEERINFVLKKVEADEDFAQLAQRFSEDEASKVAGGLLGNLHSDSTLPEIAAAMVGLDEGGTSGVIQSQFGYHILKLDEIIPRRLLPFSATKTDIMNFLLQAKTRDLFKIYLADLKKKADIQIFI